MARILFLCMLSLVMTIASPALAELILYSTIEPPQQMMEKGELTGIGVDVVRSIHNELKCPEKIKVYPWARSMSLAKKHPNSGIFLGAMTPDRAPFLEKVGPILQKRYWLYTRTDTPIEIHNLEDAKKVKSIASMHDDVRIRFLQNKGFQNLRPTADHTEGLQLLLMGRVTLWTNSDWEIGSNLRTLDVNPEKIKPAFEMFRTFNHILINNKSDPELIERWRKALKRLKDNGTMDRIARKWGEKLGLDLYFDKQSDAIGINYGKP